MKPLEPGAFRTVAAEHYGTPKEVWGFRTRPESGGPVRIARRFLRANQSLLGLEGLLGALPTARTVESLGATHVILQQRHRRLRVHRAYVTLHLDRKRRVYLVKNRAIPQALLPETLEARLTAGEAERRARKALGRRGRGAHAFPMERLWFPRRDRLELAYKVRLQHDRPRREWIFYVNARTGGILSRWDNLAKTTGRACVFDPNPVAALGGHRALLTPGGRVRRPPDAAYKEVELHDLDGTGRLDGRRVRTDLTTGRVRNPSHEFCFEAHQPGFEEANAYFHIDRAIRYLEELGYRGRRRVFTAPLRVNVRASRADQSWYSPGTRSLHFGVGAVDDAEDGETIVHEFGHALQDAIVPDFGQSEEAAAMGEGFGDYLAASFFADLKPRRYRTSVMCWDAITFPDYDPPCLRRVDESWTFEEDFVEGGDEHDNGEIWSATLWDVRRALGRRRADRIIVESHFQLDGFTRFDRGARAILDADRNLYGGRHRRALERVFRKRRIGPV